MDMQIISERDDLVIRRMILQPGEKAYWHTDPCHRFSVVVRGSRLGIEFKDSAEMLEIDVGLGQADWDVPEPRVHRAVNMGPDIYEEVVTFYRSGPDVEPQPRIE